MGKRKKRKAVHRPKVDPVEEQNKVRNAVLRVFRARVSSPGGGPAIVLPTDPVENEITMNDVESFDIPDRESSEDEIIEVIEKPSRKTMAHKEKRRKSRGKRNKDKEERLKKQAPIDQQARKEFRKHVKTAEEIISKSKVGKQRSTASYSSITQNRLTRKLGLYNQGKKSERVLREPLPVNDRILKRTDKDLRKILDISDTLNGDGQAAENSPVRSVLGSTTISAPPSTQRDSNIDNMFYSGCSSVSSSDRGDTNCEKQKPNSEELPKHSQELDMNDVADQLCGAIDLSAFPGRDLFSELQTELVRTLVINSRMTPSKSTPAIKRQARGSHSARRSLQPLMSSAEQHIENHSNQQSTFQNFPTHYDDRCQSSAHSLYSSFDVIDKHRRETSHIPCTKSRPDDKQSAEYFFDKAISHDSGHYSEHGSNNQNASTCFSTILDFADICKSQETEFAEDYSLSAIDIRRKNEEAIALKKSTAKIYNSSLDILDQMDRGPSQSRVPFNFNFQDKNYSSHSKSIFSEDEFSYQNTDMKGKADLTSYTDDLFYEPTLMPEMISPIHSRNKKKKYHDRDVKKHRGHTKICWHHDSDSDEDSPVLCYKCLGPIKIPSMDSGYSPKFHPQRMY